jgi:hypothetical protein
MDGQVVRVRAAPNDSHDAVDRRIDDVMNVAGVVALKNTHGNAVVRIEARDSLCRRRCNDQRDDRHHTQYGLGKHSHHEALPSAADWREKAARLRPGSQSTKRGGGGEFRERGDPHPHAESGLRRVF